MVGIFHLFNLLFLAKKVVKLNPFIASS
uniref:Uncharacterized protein n=1 Tax=Nelumbo nucifera TaxID=4432 RepID=A0A822Y6J9_NELNU|nr:TPA_asm: hypothetical protein HUJ06_029121 [Nelumbo nucifera]